MRRIRSVVTVVLTVVLLAAAFLSSSGMAAANPPPTTTYYLALGDSLAFGYPTGVGYAEDLRWTLQNSQPGIQLEKLGCPGESTVTMIDGGDICTAFYQKFYGGTTNQLDAALWFLRKHRDAVSYLTIDIGPNDVLPCITGLAIDAGCVLRRLATVKHNLPKIFGDLRQNLSGRTKTAGMTFYDPFTALWPLSQQLARQSVVVLNGLNIIEAGNYWRFGFRVAPVAAVFQINNFTINPYTQLPVNYAKACKWTLMCPTTPGVEPNIHPNQNGYQVIADTFARTLHVS